MDSGHRHHGQFSPVLFGATRWIGALACCVSLGCGDDDGGPNDGGAGDAGSLEVDLRLPPAGQILSYAGGLTLRPVELRAPSGLVVDLSVTAGSGVDAEVVPTQLEGSGAFELFLRPAASTVEQVVPFEVRATSGALEATAAGGLEVIAWEDDGPEHADGLLAVFLPYIAEHHPELGLGPDTEWIESWVTEPVLIVTHRSYLSTAWEVHVAWHNTAPPDDWSWLVARRRDALLPEIGFCLPTVADEQVVQRSTDLSDPRIPCAR
ncbi:MAG: hypothetical protein IT379_20930 [Deltaproteobacteria bacterium]|nr:hypothetical protein [Deltaproteobacteria bacterium]